MVFDRKTDNFPVFWPVYRSPQTSSKILLHKIEAHHIRKLKIVKKSGAIRRKSTQVPKKPLEAKLESGIDIFWSADMKRARLSIIT